MLVLYENGVNSGASTPTTRASSCINAKHNTASHQHLGPHFLRP